MLKNCRRTLHNISSTDLRAALEITSFRSSQDNTKAETTRNEHMGEHIMTRTDLINLMDKREREKWQTKKDNKFRYNEPKTQSLFRQNSIYSGKPNFSAEFQKSHRKQKFNLPERQHILHHVQLLIKQYIVKRNGVFCSKPLD